MAQDGLKRKLTAIFHCDVVAYSRHVSGDASGTHQQLSQSLELINHEIREYGGTAYGPRQLRRGGATLQAFPGNRREDPRP